MGCKSRDLPGGIFLHTSKISLHWPNRYFYGNLQWTAKNASQTCTRSARTRDSRDIQNLCRKLSFPFPFVAESQFASLTLDGVSAAEARGPDPECRPPGGVRENEARDAAASGSGGGLTSSAI